MPKYCCRHDGCLKSPYFNVSGETRGAFCGEHKTAGMVDVINRRCQSDGCTKSPSFNFPGEKRGVYCSEHRLGDMINVKHRTCEHADCFKIPSFGFPNDKTMRFCTEHKQDGMVDIKNGDRECTEENCTKRPSYGYKGQRPVRCPEHRRDDMVDLRHRLCQYSGCETVASFNVPQDTRPLYCGQHKLEGMVCHKNKCCEHDGCRTKPYFNFPGTNQGRCCSVHKEEGMVDVLNAVCESPGCSSKPSFNFPGEAKPRVCSRHKDAGMVDLKHKRCEQCTVHASYGIPGHTAAWCADHRPEGTMRHPKIMCTVRHCHNVSTHGVTKPQRCEAHALAEDSNLVERRCQHVFPDHGQCPMVDILDLNGHCGTCAAGTKRPRLAKQREVVQFLQNELASHPFTSMDQVPLELKDCGRKERPDVMWDLLDRIVLLEIDEHQHETRPCECEQARMMNISQALGCERTVWIRFNPDKFRSPESSKFASPCRRHAVLKSWLLWAFSHELPFTISVVHLFFDDFREGDVVPAQLL